MVPLSREPLGYLQLSDAVRRRKLALNRSRHSESDAEILNHGACDNAKETNDNGPRPSSQGISVT